MDMGRIVNSMHAERLASYIEDNHGGEVLTGGAIHLDKNFIEPTVVINPRMDSLMMENEIFGPILPVFKFNEF